jgi:hypothetical protein
MPRPAPSYSELESKILIFLYENNSPGITSIWLTQQFFPQIKLGTPEFGQSLEEVVKATEQLIVKGLVDGEILKSGNQLYFSDMKLKFKGKQAAIQERHRKSDLEKQLPEIARRADAVAAEMKKSEKK